MTSKEFKAKLQSAVRQIDSAIERLADLKAELTDSLVDLEGDIKAKAHAPRFIDTFNRAVSLLYADYKIEDFHREFGKVDGEKLFWLSRLWDRYQKMDFTGYKKFDKLSVNRLYSLFRRNADETTVLSYLHNPS